MISEENSTNSQPSSKKKPEEAIDDFSNFVENAFIKKNATGSNLKSSANNDHASFMGWDAPKLTSNKSNEGIA